MTEAQTHLAALSDWIKASSAPRKTPLGGDTEVGPFAVLVPLAADQAPAPTFNPEALPLWVLQAQAPADLPAIDTSAPASQDHKAQRLGHIVWTVQETERGYPRLHCCGDQPGHRRHPSQQVSKGAC